jgi:hypothetical protein
VTMPSESAQAVLLAGVFLHELANGEFSVLEQAMLRERAKALLLSYPKAADLHWVASPTARRSESNAGDATEPGVRQGTQPKRKRASRAGFSRPHPFPINDGMVVTVVVWCLPALDFVWVRDENGCQYALDRETTGVKLEDLRQGQAVECDLVVRSVKTPKVVAARVIQRRYPKDDDQV